MLNFNSSPYFDDYDSSNGYHRILYRGGMPVQTRELTQMQSILQNQIKNLSDYLFKNGQCVIPGSQTYSDDVYLCVVTKEETVKFDSDYLKVGNKFKGETSEVIMELCYWNALSDNKIEMYFIPVASTTDTVLENYSEESWVDGELKELKTFLGGESIYLVSNEVLIREYESKKETETVVDENGDEVEDETPTLLPTAVPLFGFIEYDGFSPATIAQVQKGVYYINGFFVECEEQTLVVDKTSHNPSATVGFYVVEEIATASDRYPDLYDNSVGYESEGSVGAHRYKISLKLSLKGNPKYDSEYDFVTLTRIEKGEIREDYTIEDKDRYAWLHEMLARRTYEESGNYTIKDYIFDVTKQIDIDDDDNEIENPNVLKFTASRGESYVGGYELDNTKENVSVIFNKAREEKSYNNSLIDIKYGNYILVTDFYGGIPDVNSLIYLSNNKPSTKPAMTSIVGYAHVYNVEKEGEYTDYSASSEKHTIWRVYIYDIQFRDGCTMQDVRSITGHSGISYQNPPPIYGTTLGIVAFNQLSSAVAEQLPATYKNSNNPKVNDPVNTILAYKESVSVVNRADVIYAYVKAYDKSGNIQKWVPENTVFKTTPFTTGWTPASGSVVSNRYVQDTEKGDYLIPLSSGMTKSTSDHSCYVRKSYTGSTTNNGKACSGIIRIATESTYISNIIGITAEGKEIVNTDSTSFPNRCFSNLDGSISVVTENPTQFFLWCTIYRPNASTESKSITESETKVYKNAEINAKDALNLGICDILSLDNVSYFPAGADYETIKASANNGVINVTDQFTFVEDSDTNVRRVAKLIEKTGDIGNVDAEKFGDNNYSAVDIAVTYKYCMPQKIKTAYSFSTVSSYISKKDMASNDKDMDFISDIPVLKKNSNVFPLANCIDFRPKYKENSGFIYAFSVISGATTTDKNLNPTDIVIIPQKGYYISLLEIGYKLLVGGLLYTVISISTANNTIVASLSDDEASGIKTTGINLSDVPIYYSPSNGNPKLTIIDEYNEPLANNTYVQMDYSYYLNRKDIVYLQSNGELKVDEGVSSDNPEYPEVIENQYQMPIASMYVPAYTGSLTDVSVTPFINKSYTMKDIGKLEKRIEILEDAMTLTMLEASVQNMTIVDSTGLNRYKTGYATDGFTNLNLVDYDGETIGKVDTDKGCFKPLADNFVLDTKIVNKKFLSSDDMSAGELYSSNYRIDDGILSIDYEEEVLINQPAASFWINVNPYMVYNWDGVLDISPKIDTWMEDTTVESYEYNFSTNGYSGVSKQGTTYYNNLINDLKSKGILKSDEIYNGL